ncbi:MAG: competence/damage-inducible protein A [Firmicutes bacterium]|jgi:nicotinamide-nucleotide amidase|nr:competence/damage-inducible protein A [Bacillota bacterium]
MNAELISVGTELLLGQIVNTNAAWLAERLASFGVNVYRQITVGDNLNRLAATVSDSLKRADILILTGGLGPTEDDLTREGVAQATERPLEMDEEQKARLLARYQSRFGNMPENNLKQATKPRGSIILPNPNGTACGYAVEKDGSWIFMLPGPPWEMEYMFEHEVVPLLNKFFDLSEHLFHRNLRFFGIGESALEMEILDLVKNQTDPTIAIYAALGEMQMRLTTRAKTKEEADRKLDGLHEKIKAIVGQFIYGTDEDTLFSVVAKQMQAKNLTLSLAESCTGGLLASSFTDLAGSSKFFKQGWVTYSNQSKIEQLGVKAETLEEHGAVSQQTAIEMALGARARSQSDYALAVTGIAGPDGGTVEKPVGLVWLGLAGPEGVISKELNLRGRRDQIKLRSVKNAAYLLFDHLKEKI